MIVVAALRALMMGKRNYPFVFTAKTPKAGENGWVARVNEVEIVQQFDCK